jgi:hypothetical protein
MAELVLATIAMLVGVSALAAGGTTARRWRMRRWSFFTLGGFSSVASFVLFYRVGGFEMLAFVGSGLTVLIGVGVVCCFLVSMVASLDKAPQRPSTKPAPDFSFLTNERKEADAAPSSTHRSSLARRILGSTSADRIAKMRFLTRWSFLRRGP